MRRRHLQLVAAFGLALLCITPPAPRAASVDVAIAAGTVELAPTRQQEGRELHAVDVFYAWAAEQTTTTTSPPEPATEESQHLAHFDPGSVQQLIVDIFGPAASTALRIAKCESGYDPNAHNRSGASGVFQIMLPTHAWRFEAHGWSADDWADPYKNITVAHDIYRDAGGWGPWECR